METFPALLVLCDENSPVTGEFPSQKPVTRSFGVFFDLRLNKPARRAHYDITVMERNQFLPQLLCNTYNIKAQHII